MSKWTHVNAVIRFDGLRMMGKMSGLPTKADLGKIVSYEDIGEDDVTILPMGSEGSLNYVVWDNPRENDLAAMTVMFFGDLRDYEDTPEILTYFGNLCKDRAIRSGIMEIELEFSDKTIYEYDAIEQRWVQVHQETKK